MATTITMPQLGETVTEGTVAQWLKNVGDSIEKYEPFVEVSTDKVNAEVPSPVSGVLREIIAREGETVPTGAPIAIIDEVAATASAPAATPAAPAPTVVAAAHAADVVAPAAGTLRGAVIRGAVNGNGAHVNGDGHGAVIADRADLRRYSPAVRRLARENAVDLARVRGTGTGGRVTANDVIAAAAAHEGPASNVATTLTSAEATPSAVPRPAPSAASRPSNGRPSYANPIPGETIPLSQARKIIAQRMLESSTTAPHAWTMVEVDVTNLWKWRNAEKERFARERGYSLTLLPFFIHAVVQALRAHPLMNARFTEDGIYVHREINVGIAVALDSNLVVPVIKGADLLSIAGIAVAAGTLIEKGRAGKLGADDLGGGTFTVNNTGANGSVLSKPILNGGQAGIVTMEAVVKRPVVVENDAIAIRSMMNVCLSLDHRVIDGSIANAFLNDLKSRLQAMGPHGEL
jgi:2-oxoisovalerate dehydrogenase E2 component (dihydrolipoyl transacylase)